MSVRYDGGQLEDSLHRLFPTNVRVALAATVYIGEMVSWLLSTASWQQAVPGRSRALGKLEDSRVLED